MYRDKWVYVSVLLWWLLCWQLDVKKRQTVVRQAPWWLIKEKVKNLPVLNVKRPDWQICWYCIVVLTWEDRCLIKDLCCVGLLSLIFAQSYMMVTPMKYGQWGVVGTPHLTAHNNLRECVDSSRWLHVESSTLVHATGFGGRWCVGEPFTWYPNPTPHNSSGRTGQKYICPEGSAEPSPSLTVTQGPAVALNVRLQTWALEILHVDSAVTFLDSAAGKLI